MKKLLLVEHTVALWGLVSFSAVAQIADPAPMASAPKATKGQPADAKAQAPASASSDAAAAKAKRQAEAKAANKPGEIPDAVMRGSGISAHKP